MKLNAQEPACLTIPNSPQFRVTRPIHKIHPTSVPFNKKTNPPTDHLLAKINESANWLWVGPKSRFSPRRTDTLPHRTCQFPIRSAKTQCDRAILMKHREKCTIALPISVMKPCKFFRLIEIFAGLS